MDNISEIDSHSDELNIKDIVENEPLYYVLGQFLQSSNNKNIANILEDISNELKKLNDLISKMNDS